MKTLFLLLALTIPLRAQTTFAVGDILVSGLRETVDEEGFPAFVATIRVYDRNGSFKRELVTSTTRSFSDLSVRDDVVFVGTRFPSAIERYDASGAPLATFTTEVTSPNYLSPGPDGGLLATNASGDLFAFAADGTRVRYRDFSQSPPAHAGLDLATDQCTVVFVTSARLATYDVCRDTPAVVISPSYGATSGAVRILPDGTFLVAVFHRIVHLDRDGTLLREYPIPSAEALAVDIDGTSFWTNTGNLLLHVDRATGAILGETFTDANIRGIAIVGEPRGAAAPIARPIPTGSTLALLLLVVGVAALAVLQLR